jgi:hypothetical protein
MVLAHPTARTGSADWAKRGRALAWVAGWAWALVAGGGGVGLLLIKGPWPLTNGWFALSSGLAACPLTGWAAKKYLGVAVSRWAQFGLAMFFFIAGRTALALGMTPTGPPL